MGGEAMDSSVAAILDVRRQLPQTNGSYIFRKILGMGVTYTLDQEACETVTLSRWF